MKINDFKHLHNIEVHLGRAVTVVCGLNATGKSTILSLLGHSAKDVSITLLGKKFETVYQDIMKAKYDLETKNSRCVEFTICDNTFENDVETFWYRAYWNYEDKPNRRRYRVLPVRTLTGKKDKKYDCPSLYMGLSRLYPVGESRSAKIEDFVLNRTQEDSEYIKTNHVNILSMGHLVSDLNESSVSSINAGIRKKTYGLEMPTYGAMCNSAGQDNVSQILAALRSFEKLKISKGDKWNGGLLLIDELDATLFPVTQLNLFDFLLSEAKRIGLQIVLTTHSLYLLNYICEKTDNNVEDRNNDIETIFLTNATRNVTSERNPSYSYIKTQLTNTGAVSRQEKIRIIAEDAEAQWFFKELTPKWEKYFTFNNVSIGCTDMKKLVNDKDLFDKTILLHDGDVVYTTDDLRKVNITFKSDLYQTPNDDVLARTKNVVFLPGGGCSPEELMWNYIKSKLQIDDSPIWNIHENKTPMYFCEDRNNSRPELFPDVISRDRYKKWFLKMKTENEGFLKRVISCWITESPDEYNRFIQNLIQKHKITCKINGYDYDLSYANDLATQETV